MSKSKNVLHTPLSKQGDLFDTIMPEGSLDVSLSFRDCLTKAFTRCKESRFVIAARISELSGKEISKDILDKCTSSNLDYGLRAEHVPAACYIAKTVDPIRILAAAVAGEVVTSDEADYVRLGRLLQEDQQRQIEIARLRLKIGIKGM